MQSAFADSHPHPRFLLSFAKYQGKWVLCEISRIVTGGLKADGDKNRREKDFRRIQRNQRESKGDIH